MTDWHVRYEAERQEHGRVQARSARMLGRLSFVLAQPGALDAIRSTLPSPQARSVLETLLAELDAWPARPAKAGPVEPGDALLQLVEADGHLSADQLPMRADDVDRLHQLGRIDIVAGPGYELTTAGWSWCQQAADLETRIRTLYHTIRVDNPERGPEVPLAEIRDELAVRQLTSRADINAVLVAMHEAGVIILTIDRTCTSNSRNELVINGEPRHLLTVRAGAPRATAAGDPCDVRPEGVVRVWPTDRLTDCERHLARLWTTFRGDDGDEDGLVWLTDQRAALLDAASNALADARTAAAELNPTGNVGVVAEASELVGWLRHDLARGIWPLDVTGGRGSHAASLEEAIENAWSWEETERAAGRPPMTEAQAVADIADRLTWDRPSATAATGDDPTRTRLQFYVQPSTPRSFRGVTAAETPAWSRW